MATIKNFGVGTGWSTDGITGKKNVFTTDETIYAEMIMDDVNNNDVFTIAFNKKINGTWTEMQTGDWTNSEGFAAIYTYVTLNNKSVGQWNAKFYRNNVFAANAGFKIEAGDSPVTPPADWSRIWGKVWKKNVLTQAEERVQSALINWQGQKTYSLENGWYEILDPIKMSGLISCTALGYPKIEKAITAPASGDLLVDFELVSIPITPPEEKPWYEKWFGWTLEDLQNLVFLNPIADIYALAHLLDELLPDKLTESLGTAPDWIYETGLWLFFAPALATATEGLIKAGVEPAKANTIIETIRDKGFIKALDVMKANPTKYVDDFAKLDKTLASQILKGMKKDQLAGLATQLFKASWDDMLLARGTTTAFQKLANTFVSGTPMNKVIKTIGALVGVDVLMSWLASDNIVTGTAFFINKIVDNLEGGIITKTEALEQLNRGQAFKDYATGFLEISALANPLLWLFRGILLQNTELAQGNLDQIKIKIDATGEVLPKGILTIRPTPTDAKVSVEGQFPSTGTFSEEIDIGSYNWVVSKFDYVSKSGTIDLTEAGADFSVAITKEPTLPEEFTGSLIISSEPADAKIIVAGHPEITTTGTYSLLIGGYNIYFEKEGFQPQTKYAIIYAGLPTEISAVLIPAPEPIPNKAEVLITSQPSYANVIIDGDSTYQKTPFTAYLDEGTHKIRIELNGYEPEEKDINVLWDEKKSEEFILIKTPPTKGSLKILSNPAGAQISINGESQYATTPFTTTLEAGIYKIRLSRTGYFADEQDVEVEAGFEVEHLVELEKEPLRQARIIISSLPSDADIYVDGVYQYATTPFTKLFDPRLYTIRVQKDGFYPETAYLEFEESEETEISFALTQIPQPELPAEIYYPTTPYYPTYTPTTPYVPNVISTPPEQISYYDYDLLLPTANEVLIPTNISPPTEKELLINIETTGLMPTDSNIQSIAVWDLTTPNAEPLIAVSNNEEELVAGFIQMFDNANVVKLVGYNVAFDYRFIFVKMMKYKIQSRKFKYVALVDVMQIMKQVKEAFVFNYLDSGTLDDWGKALLGKGKYGTQELELKEYLAGNFDYVKAFQNRQLELTRGLYDLARFSSGEAIILQNQATYEPNSTIPEATTSQITTEARKKQCPVCFAYNLPSSLTCEICGAQI